VKITKSHLKQIIKEELQNVLDEGFSETALEQLEHFNTAFDKSKVMGIIGGTAERVLSTLELHPFIDYKRNEPDNYESMKAIANEILNKIGAVPEIPFGGWKDKSAPSKQEQSLHRLARYLRRLVDDKLVTSLDPDDKHFARASRPMKEPKKSKFLGLFNEE
jgi:hypothetical protein